MRKILLSCLPYFHTTLRSNTEHYYYIPSTAGVNNLALNNGISNKFVFIYTQSEIASMVQPVTSAVTIDTIYFPKQYGL